MLTELNFDGEIYSKSAYILFYTRTDHISEKDTPVKRQLAKDLSTWIEKDDCQVLVSKYFNDSSFSLFALELGKTVGDKESHDWRLKVDSLDEGARLKLRDFLKYKMRPVYTTVFQTECVKDSYEHLIIGNPNNLDISFEPRDHDQKQNSSLEIHVGSCVGSLLETETIGPKGDGSFLEEKELKDLLKDNL